MGILVRNNKVIAAGGKVLYRTGNPFDLQNLKLYLSATRMPQQADESSVSSFVDYSGNGFNATQTTGSLQPKFDTNQFGVNAGVRGDGVDDILNLTGGALDIFRNVSEFTAQVLVKRSVLSANSPIVQFTQNGTLSSRFIIQFTSAGLLQVAVRMLDATVTAVSITANSNDLNSHFVQATVTGGIMYVYLDGVLVGTTTLDATTSSNTSSSNAYVCSIPTSFGNAIINGVSVHASYSNSATIQAQYRGYLQRGYL